MRARHFVVYEGDDLMAFSSEEEQLRKFRNDEIAQHYFEGPVEQRKSAAVWIMVTP